MSVQDEVADTGLMMMGHRFYAPDHGRFLNRDPIGFAGGMNLFEYTSSPVQMVDPTGLENGYSINFYKTGQPDKVLYPEDTQANLEFIGSFHPGIGFSLALRDYNEDPSAFNGGMLVLSAVGLGGARLLKSVGTARRAATLGVTAGEVGADLKALHPMMTPATPELLAEIGSCANVSPSRVSGIFRSTVLPSSRTITWGEKVRLVEAAEEWLHTWQLALRGHKGPVSNALRKELELEAKDLILAHADSLNLNLADRLAVHLSKLKVRIVLAGVK